MLDIARQVLAFRQTEAVTYGISGRFYLASGRVPFESNGVLLEKGAFSGSEGP